MIGDIPLIGGLQVFFMRQPEIDFDLGGAANLLEIPGIHGLLMGAIDDQVAKNLVLPNKLSIILSDQVSAERVKMPTPEGVLAITVVEAK